MSWAQDTKTRLQVLAIVLAFLCPAFLIWGMAETAAQIGSYSWPAVDGEVQDTIAKPWKNDENRTMYFGRVIYRYAVNGREFTSELTDLGPGIKRDSRQDALADVGQFLPGMKLKVYYNPHDPQVGVLSKGIPTIHFLLLIGLVVGSLVGALVSFFTVHSWLKSRRRLAQDPNSTAPQQLLQTETGAGLGDCIQRFKPNLNNVFAGFVISALLGGGGLAAIVFPLRAAYLARWNLPFNVKQGWSWLEVGLFCLLGIGGIVGGIALALYSRSLLSRRVEICLNGFRYCSRRSTDDVPWAEVSLIQETTLYERPPILKGPAKLVLPKCASKSYQIVTRRGKEYAFDGNSIGSIKRFGQVLEEQASRLGLPWKAEEQQGY